MPTRRIVILAAVIVAAVGLPIAADRTVAGLAEDRLADRLSCLAGDVHVSLGGLPFLTQVASGTFDDVQVRAGEVTFRDLTMTSLNVTAHGVRVPEDGEASADSLVAQAVVPYAILAGAVARNPNQNPEVTDIAGAQFGGDGAGRLTITTELNLRGRQVPATIYAGLTVAGGDLILTPEEIELVRFGIRVPAAQLPAGASEPRTIKLPELPAGFAYGDITATQEGLGLTVTGHGLRGTLGAGAVGSTSTTTVKTCGATAR